MEPTPTPDTVGRGIRPVNPPLSDEMQDDDATAMTGDDPDGDRDRCDALMVNAADGPCRKVSMSSLDTSTVIRLKAEDYKATIR